MLDATIAHMAARAPISDPLARFHQAEKIGREEMLHMTRSFSVRGKP